MKKIGATSETWSELVKRRPDWALQVVTNRRAADSIEFCEEYLEWRGLPSPAPKGKPGRKKVNEDLADFAEQKKLEGKTRGEAPG